MAKKSTNADKPTTTPEAAAKPAKVAKPTKAAPKAAAPPTAADAPEVVAPAPVAPEAPAKPAKLGKRDLMRAALTKEPQSMKELKAAAGLTNTMYNFLNGLVAKGEVVKTEDGKYRLP
jgi:nucleoid-associated protein YgaU